MAAVSSVTTINRPVDQVFAFVIGVENYKAWQAGILDAKVTPLGPIAVGSIIHYTTEYMGRRFETQLKVSAFVQNEKWATMTTGVPRPVETVYLFEGDANTTKLTISMDITGAYPAAAEGMMNAQMQKTLGDQGLKIKQVLEK
jgi:hypothetical protein